MSIKVKVFAGILAIVAMIGIFALIANTTFSTPEPVGYVRVTVKSGDTLWAIGARNCNKWNVYDNQEIVHAMKEKSGCSATIYPGQTIYVPIYED